MNVSLQTKNKMVLMPIGTPMPTKTRIQLWQGAVLTNNDVVALGAKKNYPSAQAGTYQQVSQNITDDGTTVGPSSQQTVVFVEQVSVPVADGVDIIYEQPA